MKPYDYLIPWSSWTGDVMPVAQEEMDLSGVENVDDCAAHGISDCSGSVWHHMRQVGTPVYYPIDWRENKIFPATMTVAYYVKRSNSSSRVWLTTGPGLYFPMFVTDFIDMTKEASILRGEITGRWRVRKRGLGYGVILWQK